MDVPGNLPTPVQRSAAKPTSLGSFVRPLNFLAISIVTLSAIGCGSKSAENATSSSEVVAASENETAGVPQPTEIVSQFLDRVRRGGNDSTASELLTKLAQQEMTRIGRPLQFPGSPDTTFEVKTAFPVPDQDNSVWVQTVLAEPMGEAGETFQYEVVWTLRKEVSGWRISGFVVDQGDGLEPMEIDFENGDEMEARLAAIEAAEAA